MDQTQYWMLMKRRQLLMKSHFHVSVNSWEEKAFAEDRGCVWPPRSYVCSFCKREFRSAQALGGHMNVHRRDRARLKQANDASSSCSKISSQEGKRSLNNGVLNPNPQEEQEDKISSSLQVETSLSVGLSSVFSFKRPKINVVAFKPVVVSGSMDELDLELRLGVLPKGS